MPHHNLLGPTECANWKRSREAENQESLMGDWKVSPDVDE